MNLIRVYIFEGYRDTVIESQVFNWAGALDKIGLKTIGLSLINRRKFNSDNMSKLKKVSEKYNIDVFSNMFDNYPLLRELQITIAIIRIFLRLKNKKTKVVFQTRMPGLIFIVPICRLLLGVRFIIDLRSSPLTEYLYSNPRSTTFDRRRITFSKIENMVVKYSDAVFCVSNVLKQYLLNHYGSQQVKQDKITVIPGAADQELFFYNDELRRQTRLKLDCSDRIVFTYSGRLDKLWQIPDKVFDLVSYLNQRIPASYFLFLTPDIEIARIYCKSSGISETSYNAIYTQLDGINQYLNAADYAIILREDLPINHHASPTKISEYLLTGLPVIISQNIGDFSTFIDINRLGCVIDINQSQFQEKVCVYVEQNIITENEAGKIRKLNSELAIRNYAKDSYLNIIQKTCMEI